MNVVNGTLWWAVSKQVGRCGADMHAGSAAIDRCALSDSSPAPGVDVGVQVRKGSGKHLDLLVWRPGGGIRPLRRCRRSTARV